MSGRPKNKMFVWGIIRRCWCFLHINLYRKWVFNGCEALESGSIAPKNHFFTTHSLYIGGLWDGFKINFFLFAAHVGAHARRSWPRASELPLPGGRLHLGLPAEVWDGGPRQKGTALHQENLRKVRRRFSGKDGTLLGHAFFRFFPVLLDKPCLTWTAFEKNETQFSKFYTEPLSTLLRENLNFLLIIETVTSFLIRLSDPVV